MDVVGREGEFDAVGDFLTSPARALLIAGEVGIGKTTLWERGVARARELGHRVLVTRALEAEAPLGLSGLGDLLEDVTDDDVDVVPPPQRRALRIALLRDDAGDDPPDPRSLATAVLGVLRALAGRGPVLVAIDDVVWLDPATARVLSFGLRRVGSAPIRLLATVRTDAGGEVPAIVTDVLDRDHVVELRPGPLSRAELRRLLVERLGTNPDRRTLAVMHDASGGNPYLALELAGSALVQGPVGPDGSVPVPSTLRRLVQGKVTALSGPARDLVLAAALSPTAPLDAVVAAGPPEWAEHVNTATAAGIVERRDGQLVFTHPLLRSVTIDDAAPAERRDAHRRLAATVTDPLTRAAHLARASEEPDPAVAGELDRAARLASARGMTETAVELADLAVTTTPRADVEAVRARSLAAAEHRFAAGDAATASAVAQRVASELRAGVERARVLERLATYQRNGTEQLERWSSTLAQALDEAGDGDAELRLRLHYGLGLAALNGGDPAAAPAHLRAVVELADRCGDRVARARGATAELWVAFNQGKGVRHDLLATALSEPEATGRLEVENRPSYTAALTHALAGDLGAARTLLEQDRLAATERGDEASLPIVLWLLVLVETWTGDWPCAVRLAEHGSREAALAGADAGEAFMAAARAHLHAGRGDVQAALDDAATTRARCERSGLTIPRWIGAWGGAAAALSIGDAAVAHGLLGELTDEAVDAGVAEPGLALFVPDEVEALVRLGEPARARALIEPFAARADELGRDRAALAARRSVALLAAAEGRREEASAALDQAVELGSRLGLPLEQARTLLVAGEIRRRWRQRGRARDHLLKARAILDGLGARQWLARCEAELRSYDGASPAEPLTATERKVAEMAAEGMTSREIAGAVFASVRTVETHLHRVYLKLGVHSRVDLTRLLSERSAGSTDSPPTGRS